MSFAKGVEYTREQIADILGVTSAEAVHAVILKTGSVEAIVVAANGKHPSGKKYQNTLSASVFTMHGEKDQRGAMLEQSSPSVQLFYSHSSNGSYRYEGRVRWVKTTDYAGGDPFREFTRDTD